MSESSTADLQQLWALKTSQGQINNELALQKVLPQNFVAPQTGRLTDAY
jgi:hypothetical protein